MGAGFGGQCYADVATAAAAQCAAGYPIVRVDGSGNHVSETCSVGVANELLVAVAVAETATSSVVTIPTAYPVCDPNEKAEVIGALFLALLAGLVAVALVRMTFWPLMQNQ